MGPVRTLSNRCVRLEAALHRVISVRHQSTARVIREQMDPDAFESLSLYFDVISDHSVQCSFKTNTPNVIWTAFPMCSLPLM